MLGFIKQLFKAKEEKKNDTAKTEINTDLLVKEWESNSWECYEHYKRPYHLRIVSSILISGSLGFSAIHLRLVSDGTVEVHAAKGDRLRYYDIYDIAVPYQLVTDFSPDEFRESFNSIKLYRNGCDISPGAICNDLTCKTEEIRLFMSQALAYRKKVLRDPNLVNMPVPEHLKPSTDREVIDRLKYNDPPHGESITFILYKDSTMGVCYYDDGYPSPMAGGSCICEMPDDLIDDFTVQRFIAWTLDECFTWSYWGNIYPDSEDEVMYFMKKAVRYRRSLKYSSERS